jgi:hypothetical protein
LNDKHLIKAVSHEVKHGDRLSMYKDTIFVLHMHTGLDTCLNCETSHVLSKLPKPSEPARVNRERLRREKNNELRKKYGIERAFYEAKSDVKKKKGNVEEGSLVADHNSSVGQKMMEKMGWKEGYGLGKANQGIKEAVGSHSKIF